MKLKIITAEVKNYVPVRLKEEADKAGFETEIIDITKTLIVETTNGSKIVHVKDNQMEVLEPPFACIPRLNEHHLLYKLNVLKQLELSGAFLLNSSASMELCNDKLATQVVLNAEKINTPYSIILGSPEMLEYGIKQLEADSQLKFPIIVKTLRGTHGIGVMKVDSKSSLVSVVQALLAQQMEVMIQEFIEHKESLRIIMIGDEILAANRRGQPKDLPSFYTPYT